MPRLRVGASSPPLPPQTHGSCLSLSLSLTRAPNLFSLLLSSNSSRIIPPHSHQWYFEVTDPHNTLDYPPLFAHFESFLSNIVYGKILYRLYPTLVSQSCFELRNYETRAAFEQEEEEAEETATTTIDAAVTGTRSTSSSSSCIAFMRCTVILTDVFVLAPLLYLSVLKSLRLLLPPSSSVSSSSLSPFPVFALVYSNASLLLIDHVHFQYNGLMIAMLVYAVIGVGVGGGGGGGGGGGRVGWGGGGGGEGEGRGWVACSSASAHHQRHVGFGGGGVSCNNRY